jgi:predicted DNA-binding transcriptional regulator YafY
MSKDPKAANIIRLYEDFLSGRTLTKSEIAERLGVTDRTAMRYITELRDAIGLEYRVQGPNRRHWHLPRDRREFRAKLERDDVLSLAVAITVLDQYEGSYLADSLATLHDEIAHWWRSADRDLKESARWRQQKFHAIRFLPYRYREDGAVFFEVVAALASGQKLEFTYRPWSGRAGKRKVRPYSLVFHKGAFYLVALVDHAKEHYDPSTFMLARMSDARVLDGESYLYPKDWDPRAFYPKIEGMLQGDQEPLVALFDGRYHDYLKRDREWPAGTTIKREKDKVRFSARLVLNEELLNWFLGFGGDVEILEPESFREWIAEKARAAADMYRAIV